MKAGEEIEEVGKKWGLARVTCKLAFLPTSTYTLTPYKSQPAENIVRDNNVVEGSVMLQINWPELEITRAFGIELLTKILKSRQI